MVCCGSLTHRAAAKEVGSGETARPGNAPLPHWIESFDPPQVREKRLAGVGVSPTWLYENRRGSYAAGCGFGFIGERGRRLALGVPRRELGNEQEGPFRQKGPTSSLDQFLAAADQRPQPLGEQLGVERLLERFVDCRAVEAERAAVIRQQRDQNRLGEIDVLPQVLADL